MLDTASSDLDSGISISASHAGKRAAKAAAKAAVITAAEKKRLDDEEVIRSAKNLRGCQLHLQRGVRIFKMTV